MNKEEEEEGDLHLLSASRLSFCRQEEQVQRRVEDFEQENTAKGMLRVFVYAIQVLIDDL